MRCLLAAALAVGIAAWAVADDEGYMAFRRAMADAHLQPTRLAFRLWQCNVAASRRLAHRPPLARVKLTIEDEAAEAMASCTAEIEALAQDIPANGANIEAIKAVIMRANATTIREARDPPRLTF